MKERISLKGIVLDLCSQRHRLIKIIGKAPELDDLINLITLEDYYNDEDLSIPKVKEMATKLNITYDKIRRQLKKLYELTQDNDLIREAPFVIKKQSVFFLFEGFNDSMQIKVNGLNQIPSKGHRVSIPYFKELVGTDFFHVREVSHEFRDNKFETLIWLKAGSYNSYWDLRKDQAIETNEINLFDSFKKDHEIKKMLNITPQKAW